MVFLPEPGDGVGVVEEVALDGLGDSGDGQRECWWWWGCGSHGLREGSWVEGA